MSWEGEGGWRLAHHDVEALLLANLAVARLGELEALGLSNPQRLPNAWAHAARARCPGSRKVTPSSGQRVSSSLDYARLR